MARIIDAILVQKNSPNQSAELDQRVPVAAIAGQADASIASTKPTRPSQIAARRRSAGSIEAAPRARPRSSSITSTDAQPS